MSTPAAPTPPRRPAKRKGPNPITVVTGTLGLFLIVLTLLAFQVRAGKDPSLSQGAPAAATAGANGAGASSATAKATRNVVTKTS